MKITHDPKVADRCCVGRHENIHLAHLLQSSRVASCIVNEQ